ncbi:AAA family ATPase [Dyadobacter sediminis]|uniref:SMC family ATPase n=1 Tax=Dyadobacter sediminis TaxID=1493691 RepID=A0A5R9K7D7_9BACT|nr:SMC family ATPase [Dyadobacter sediminis]TLU89777.1 SMC family ATPase [Dyadobacter sediminis]GGC12919.1 nuclease SbcCD subunit C [Dyadobacter sediminis]
MIPKYLKIKGLYSYQTEQEIHFDALTNASLFGIFGSVGSGKSSILEAITFALYGDTERLNKSGDDRTYNMMNLRSDDLLIDFECIAGKKAGHYRFTVKGKRNSKNFKDVKTFERKAYIRHDESWLPLSENETTENIVGLSYDNFRRTIIIPQGRFQEFIELKDSERTKMMKELFQLEKYDLSRNVGSLSKANDMNLSHFEGQLLGLQEIAREKIDAEKEKREGVRLKIRELEDLLLVQTELESSLQKQKLAGEKIQLLKNQLSQLEAKRAAMQQREEMLRDFEICSLHFRSFLDQKSNLNAAISKAQQTYDKNQQRISELTVLTAKENEVLFRLKPQYEKKEELLDTAEELEKVILILENTLSAEKKKGALARGEEQLKQKEIAIDLLRNQKLEKEAENEQRKSQYADIQEISLAKSWFDKLDTLNEDRISIKKEAEGLQAAISTQQEELKLKLEEITQTFSLNRLNDFSIESFQNAVQECLADIENKKKLLHDQLLQANTKLALQQFAGSLTDGEPCPLCGSGHHPAVLHADFSLSEEIKDIEKRSAAWNEKEKSLQRVQSPVERMFNQIENLEKQKAAIKQRWLEAKNRMELHDKEFTWSRFDKNDRDGFQNYFQKVSKNQSRIREAETELKSLSAQLETALIEKEEKIEKPLQNLRNEILKLDNTAATLTSQLKKVNPADFEGQEKSAISEKISGLKSGYKEIIHLYEQAEKNVDTLEKEKNMLSGSQTTLKNALETDELKVTDIQKHIDGELKLHVFESEGKVREILQQAIQTETERKVIQDYKFSLETTGRDLQNMMAENQDSLYDAEKHKAVTYAKEQLAESLHYQRKEEGSLDGLIRKMDADLSRKVTLEKEKSRLLLRKEHLDDLARLFRSSGFVDYASSIYLQNLIQAANSRFHQMTHQQLHLELGEGNSFWVRDLLNGGHMRLLKTLSGGQKFQAALSLALALADHIHVRNESRHNFFFLDEGFGSLDKNALQTVFETLKSLRKENRIVGIISHVEDLQQEINTYLSITGSEDGSRIVASWR